MFVGLAASTPFWDTDNTAVAPGSVILAVAVGVVILMLARLGLLIVASTVSVASRSASFRTVTVSVPVVAPLATLIAAGPPKAVKSEPLVALPPLFATVNVIGDPELLAEPSVTV